VELLVSGLTYTHKYWDPRGLRPEIYSYARIAAAAGHATFALDRLAVGDSTRPTSTAVTMNASVQALYSVIGQLRGAGIAGHHFSRLFWVGQSLGAEYAWVYAQTFPNTSPGGQDKEHIVDAFALTAVLHFSKPSFANMALGALYPAQLDPKFAGAGLDSAYLTTQPNTRGALFYYGRTADSRAIAADERDKDTVSLTEAQQAIPLVQGGPPDDSPSRAVAAHTLLVVGANDNTACGPPDGISCTPDGIAKQERPYYSDSAHLRVAVIPSTGHSINLHRTAPIADATILAWLFSQ
jgi:pimeloyl-ACP methyl ester carboxylesterase